MSLFTSKTALITDHRELSALAKRWRQMPSLAIDTEFVRTRTFYPRLGLIQLADRDGIALIDPLAIRDLQPLMEVLTAPEVLKVFHSCGEDLEVLYHLMGAFPQPVFDTQMAAAFCGHGHSLGYARLVHLMFGEELSKGETRTDWLRRPLSEAQLRYAAQDVHYLLPMQQELAARLADDGRMSWLREETEGLFDSQRFEPLPSEAYRRVKQHRALSPRALVILRRLAQWREEEARRRDLPRGFVLHDKVLIHLAKQAPRNDRQLAATPLLSPAAAKRLAPKILRMIREVLSLADRDLPQAPRRAFDTAPHKGAIQGLRDRVQQRAEELDLAPELLATRRQVERLFARVATGKEPPLQEEMRGWRREVIGEELRAMARDALA